jgi:hypothetical protein
VWFATIREKMRGKRKNYENCRFSAQPQIVLGKRTLGIGKTAKLSL